MTRHIAIYSSPPSTYKHIIYITYVNLFKYYLFPLGDLVSPGFSIPNKTTMDIVTEPLDSADGYLFDFAINLQTLIKFI